LIDFPDPQRAIPAMAREPRQLSAIANLVAQLPTEHVLACCDAREISLPDNSVHLVVTSPPYWTLEKYRSVSGQLGDIADYEEFLSEPDRVWRLCLDSVG
jgi:tRNA G10  N-methylase Trm11